MLHELPGLLKEFFAGPDGRVRLPEESALLYGALSHVAARGLDNYADEVVPCPGLNYNIIVPLGGICSEGLIRMMVGTWTVGCRGETFLFPMP
jgi:hypothetical protein